MAKFRILVVDNEEGMLEVCHDILQRLPETEVITESVADKAAELVESEVWDLLVTDLRMPGMTGIELIRHARSQDSGISTLIMTAFPSVDTAVEGMKLGASDYLVKPFKPAHLLAAVRRLLAEKRLREENQLLSRSVEKSYSFGEMIGGSPAMRRVFDTVAKVAETGVDVLISGATGTGKELVARSLHRLSPRAGERFVPVDCGAIPDNLLESEFFGYERGAFTGASSRSLGLMEYADKGTLFLDELGELPMHLQAKLLRALQERTIRRLGGTSEVAVDLRIVAATSRDLSAEVERGKFRADLFYRVNVIHIEIPPLSRRRDDIPLLLEHFMRLHAAEMNREGVTLGSEAMRVLQEFDWPGNVRQLQNVTKRILAVAASDTIGIDGLPGEIVVASDRTASTDRGFFAMREVEVARFEREYFRRLMDEHAGDVTRAADAAGVPRGTLYRLLSKHGIVPSQYRT